MLAVYKELIRLRKSRPDLSDPRLDRVEVWPGDRHVAIRRGNCVVVANLAPETQRINVRGIPRKVLFASEPGLALWHDSVDLPGESAAVLAYARR
jgi:maltooligosyltrehalose trehalohydrolase